jgi:hypothetical protein
MRMLADPVLGWKGEVGPVNKFFNTGQICTKQVTSLESWILSEGRPAMGISFPLDIYSFSGGWLSWNVDSYRFPCFVLG